MTQSQMSGSLEPGKRLHPNLSNFVLSCGGRPLEGGPCAREWKLPPLKDDAPYRSSRCVQSSHRIPLRILSGMTASAASADEWAGVVLSDLPDECILRTVGCLEDPRDVLSFEMTCRRFWQLGREPKLWAKSLQRTFDLRLKAWPQFSCPMMLQSLQRHIL